MAKGPRTLDNSLTRINFIGEELQAFSARFIKFGVVTKEDLKGIIEDVNQRVTSLNKIISDIQTDHLN